MFSTCSRVSFIGQSATRLAMASAQAWMPIRVFWRELMTAVAMRLSTFVRAGLRAWSRHILGNSHHSQMRRIDAPSMSAQVIDNQSFRNWPMCQFVGNAMGVARPESTVTAPSPRPEPFPAVGEIGWLFDFIPQVVQRTHTRPVVAFIRAEFSIRSGWVAKEHRFTRGALHSNPHTRILPRIVQV